MILVGFEPTIPVFEQAKTDHALDLAATEIGEMQTHILKRTVGRYGDQKLSVRWPAHAPAFYKRANSLQKDYISYCGHEALSQFQ
jgi:hypothetical protein